MSTRLHLAPHRIAGLKTAFLQEVLIVVPLVWLGILLTGWIESDIVALDFHHYYWPAGERVRHGDSPYIYGPWYPSDVPVGFVYPAPAAVLFSLISIVPRQIGDTAFAAIALLAPAVAMRTLGVRDYRCFGTVLLWPPVTYGVQTANLSMLLTAAVAVVWMQRDRAWVAGLLLGMVVAMKLFLVPLVVFFVATRRLRAAAYALATAAIVSGALWLVLGLDELSRYRETVDRFTALRTRSGYSVAGLAERLGTGREGAYVVAVCLAAAAVLACLWLARRGREKDAFVLAICACLLATPIVWAHYFTLLLIPVALAAPRLHPLWFVPIAMWFGLAAVHPSPAQTLAVLALFTGLVGASLRLPDRPRVAASG